MVTVAGIQLGIRSESSLWTMTPLCVSQVVPLSLPGGHAAQAPQGQRLSLASAGAAGLSMSHGEPAAVVSWVIPAVSTLLLPLLVSSLGRAVEWWFAQLRMVCQV